MINNDNDLTMLGRQLVLLPVAMANLGHTNISGHKRYVRGQPMLEAYLA